MYITSVLFSYYYTSVCGLEHRLQILTLSNGMGCKVDSSLNVPESQDGSKRLMANARKIRYLDHVS